MKPLVFAGHPFASTGVGAQFRSHVAAALAVGLDVRVFDLFGNVERTDAELVAQLAPLETDALGDGVRVFHVNGDEVERTLARLASMGQDFHGGTNVIVPAWELALYPPSWARELKRFHEVWALSNLIRRALAPHGIAAVPIGQAVEPVPGPLLPRRHFGLRESATVFLAFCDLSSFVSRKNPEGTLDLFERLGAAHPDADLQCVLKVKEAEGDAEGFVAPLRAAHPGVFFLVERLSALETRSLMAGCDCFVSLHRAEGFGRAVAEAMLQGRIVLSTGGSGNLDFTDANNALLVDSRRAPVRPGEYPFGDGQFWAEPDIEHATTLAGAVVRNDEALAPMRRRARGDIARFCGSGVVGLRIADGVATLASTRRPGASRDSVLRTTPLDPAKGRGP